MKRWKRWACGVVIARSCGCTRGTRPRTPSSSRQHRHFVAWWRTVARNGADQAVATVLDAIRSSVEGDVDNTPELGAAVDLLAHEWSTTAVDAAGVAVELPAGELGTAWAELVNASDEQATAYETRLRALQSGDQTEINRVFAPGELTTRMSRCLLKFGGDPVLVQAAA